MGYAGTAVKNKLLKKTPKVSFPVAFPKFSFHCVTLWCLDAMSCFMYSTEFDMHKSKSVLHTVLQLVSFLVK